MGMNALRKGISGGIFKYFLLGLLLAAGGSLVFMDIGGFFRGGISNSDVAKIGNQSISIQQFDRIVRTTLPRIGLQPQQAYQLGYMNELLGGEINAALINQQSQKLGIRVGTQAIAENIEKIVRPMAQPGQSAKDVLHQILTAQGMSEAELAGSIRREMTINLLSNTVQSGFLYTSQTLVNDLAALQNETREIEYIAFEDKNYKGVEAPDDETLDGYYQMAKESLAKPETRVAQVIAIDRDKVKQSLEISDEEIADVYERNIASYSEPEIRNIEQTIVSDEATAGKIAELVQNGKALKAATQETAGNTTDFIPAKDTQKSELLDPLQDPVYTAEKGAVIGPIQTGLGYHIAVIKDIKPAHTRPLDEMKNTIKDELMETRLLDSEYDIADSIDDFLASGQDISTIEQALPVKLKALPPVNSFGLDSNDKAVLTPEFGPDTQDVVSAMFETSEGQGSPIMELTDGQMIAVYVTKVNEKSYPAFEDVKDSIKNKWIADNKRIQNKMHALEIMGSANEKTMQDIARAEGQSLKTSTINKTQNNEKSFFSPTALANIFTAPKDEIIAVDLAEGTALVKVKKINLPEKLTDEQIKAAENSTLQALQNEAFTLYLGQLRDNYKVTVNEKLLRAAYGPSDQN